MSRSATALATRNRTKHRGRRTMMIKSLACSAPQSVQRRRDLRAQTTSRSATTPRLWRKACRCAVPAAHVPQVRHSQCTSDRWCCSLAPSLFGHLAQGPASRATRSRVLQSPPHSGDWAVSRPPSPTERPRSARLAMLEPARTGSSHPVGERAGSFPAAHEPSPCNPSASARHFLSSAYKSAKLTTI